MSKSKSECCTREQETPADLLNVWQIVLLGKLPEKEREQLQATPALQVFGIHQDQVAGSQDGRNGNQARWCLAAQGNQPHVQQRCQHSMPSV